MGDSIAYSHTKMVSSTVKGTAQDGWHSQTRRTTLHCERYSSRRSIFCRLAASCQYSLRTTRCQFLREEDSAEQASYVIAAFPAAFSYSAL